MTDSSEPIPAPLPLVYEISRVVSSGSPLDEMLQALIRLAAGVTGCDACLVYLPEPSSGDVVLRASQLPHTAEIGKIRMKMGEGVTGWVAEHGSVVALSRNASGDVRFKSFASLAEDSYEAFLCVPLISGGKVIGVLNVHHKEPRTQTQQEIALLMFVGEQMGGAIAQARLAEESRRLQRETMETKRKLETRKLVERAKGILQRTCQLSEEEAYHRLHNESRRTRRPMGELAKVIIMAEELSREGKD